MMTFAPNYSVLQEPQRAVLPELRFAARHGFTLYGGTAIALRLGHRQSVDFDFFSTEPFDKDRILRDSSLMRDGQVLQNTGQTLTLSIVRAGGAVKISFFGSLNPQRAASLPANPY
jgi:hypothetical protein